MSRHASLNRLYRLVWSSLHHAWIAVAENARGRGKTGRLKLAGAALLLCAAQAQAAPAGGQVVGGAASISQSGSTTTIEQNSPKLSVNWQRFNVGSQETVNFVQPSAAAIAVNRIYDTAGSQILGKLNANGQVWLINPNGVLFGPGAQVNVGGLIASTLELNGVSGDGKTASFTGSASGSVINQGRINAGTGGYVALLGKSVTNSGTISAPQGTVALGAGSTVTLNFNGNSLASLQVEQSLLDTLAANGGLIQADGGQVLLSAGARDSVIASVVNNTGVIEARTVENQSGNIVLLAGMAAGTTLVGGKLDASAPNGGQGGFIETSAHAVHLQPGAAVTAGAGGRWLIDPTNIVIDSTAAATLAGSLNAGTNVDQTTSSAGSDAGNITVSSAINWSGTGSLSLTANNNIAINAAISGLNGGLTLSAGGGISAAAAVNVGTFTLSQGAWSQISASLPAFSATDFRLNGGSFVRALSGTGSSGSAYQLTDIYGVQGIGTQLGKSYVLANEIDASGTARWNGGAGFVPIGSVAANFVGTFDGQGHAISKLTIKRPATHWVGLFGFAVASEISNVGLLGGSVEGANGVGALAGFNAGTISNSYATSSVSGSLIVGGLVGEQSYGGISNSYATGRVEGYSKAGGLVGYCIGCKIGTSYATGRVTGTSDVGGLVGSRDGGSVNHSYWNSDTTDQSSSAGGTPLDNDNWTQAGFTGFDFNATPGASGNKWYMVDGGSPLLASEYSTTIMNAHQLQLMSMAPAASYTLGANIDAAATGIANSDVWGSAGFSPVGSSATRFTGTFDGQGHTVSNLTINRPETNNVGMFGHTGAESKINGVGLVGGSVTGYVSVGGLAGNNLGSVSNSYSSTSVAGNYYIGGLVGENQGSVTNSYASGNVTGSSGISGGLVGYNHGAADISDSYATGNVAGGSYLGGLVGRNEAGVTRSYATGKVTGSAGGNGYGGLVGSNNTQGSISYSYASGVVSGSSYRGGLVGVNQGTVAHSFWNTTTGGATGIDAGTTTGATGKSAADMQQLATFVNDGWSIDDAGSTASVWRIYDGQSAPLLRSFLTPLTVTLASGSRTYNGTTTGLGVLSYSSAPNANLLGTATSVAASKNVGRQTLADSGLYSNQQGYDIGYVSGTLDITQASLTISTNSVSKTYDGTTRAIDAAATVTGGTLFSGDTLTGGSFAFADKNVGSGNKTVTVAGVSVSDGNGGGNYHVTFANNTTSTINQANLIVSTANVSKTYNGSTDMTGATGQGVVVTSGSLFGGDTLSGGTFAYADKNAGSGNKTVRISGVSVADGNGGGNYKLTLTDNTTSTITPAELTISGLTASDKTYDGSAAAVVSTGGVVKSGLVAGDELTVAATGTFNDKNVGSGKSVTLSSSYGGADAGNYTITSQLSSTASITAKAITGSIAAADKIYDGMLAAATSASLSGVIAGDTVTLASSGAFADQNVGTGKAVAVSGVLAGSDAGNYTVATNAMTTAAIAPATLVYTATPASVVVGQPVEAVLGGTLTGFVGGDRLGNATTGSARWTSAASAVQLPGKYAVTGSGLAATNYVFAQAAGNATALTLQANAPSAALVPITAQLVSGLLASPGTLGTTVPAASQALPAGLTVATGGAAAQTEALPALYQPATKTDVAAAPAAAAGPAWSDSALRIEDGGVRLPDTRLRLN